MNNEKDDNFLGRWLNNDLTEEERKEFEASEEYLQYQKIVAASDNILPVDINLEDMLLKVKGSQKHEISDTDRSKAKGIRWWSYAVAASLILLVGFFFIYNNDTIVTSGYGEQVAINLPDGSEMILNAQSRGTFSETGWEDNRTIKLEGEAYFQVEKGVHSSLHDALPIRKSVV